MGGSFLQCMTASISCMLGSLPDLMYDTVLASLPPPPSSSSSMMNTALAVSGVGVEWRRCVASRDGYRVPQSLGAAPPSEFVPLLLCRRPYSRYTINMPRAVSEKVSRVHQPAAATRRPGTSGSSASSSAGPTTKNPIFNTDRFGQHILKNPLVAQQ